MPWGQRGRGLISAPHHTVLHEAQTWVGGQGSPLLVAHGLSLVGHPVVVCVWGNFLIGAGQV